MGRRLSEEEKRVWDQLSRTITPLAPKGRRPIGAPGAAVPSAPATAGKGEVKPEAVAATGKKVRGRVPPALPPKPAAAPAPKGPDQLHLDGSWEKRIAKGTLVPDFSLDLHGSNLDLAWRRLMDGLAQGKAMGARVILVVTGRPRPVDAMDRGESRGAIRAKIKDWLTVSEHAHDIVAIRGAHRRHGGAGALYIVLKRRR
ncbi:Smr/MutS family protein [Novosphingobium organovorum]